MKSKKASMLVWILYALNCFSQSETHELPIIDMHLHVYTPQNYWGGFDFKVIDTTLASPADQAKHLDAVIQQIERNNIVKTYASGNFEALDIINELYPDLFLPSEEILPTSNLLKDTAFINTLERKIISGEIRAIGEVANFYTGIAPNDPVMDTLYKIAVKYDLPIGLHFAAGPPGSQFNQYPNMRLENANPLLLQDVLIKFPKLRLYIMHAGVPIFMEETFAMIFMYRNLYVDISALAWYNTYGKLSLDEFLKRACLYGYDNRIMFGSDEMAWPGAIGISIDYIRNADFLTEKQKRNILYNNAAKFLRLSENEISKHFQNSN